MGQFTSGKALPIMDVLGRLWPDRAHWQIWKQFFLSVCSLWTLKAHIDLRQLYSCYCITVSQLVLYLKIYIFGSTCHFSLSHSLYDNTINTDAIFKIPFGKGFFRSCQKSVFTLFLQSKRHLLFSVVSKYRPSLNCRTIKCRARSKGLALEVMSLGALGKLFSS